MSWAIKKYYQCVKGRSLSPFIIIFLVSACMADYHFVTYPVFYRSGMPCTTFSIIVTEADDSQNLILDSISKGLELGLQTLGLKKDSLKPDLLFIIRWETHLIGHSSAASNKAVREVHSVANQVNSPFKNTSAPLRRNSSGSKIRRHNRESFYRIQAIDALKSELAWSVKIHPRKTKGLRPESVPQMIQELIRSFSQVQLNHSMSEKHEYDDNQSFGGERTL